MSERGRGSNKDRGRGRGRGRGGSSASERPKKESILDMSKYMDQQIRVKFAGGREVIGTLKGYDQLLNLVLDDCEENLRDPEDGRLLDKTRTLGLTVLRGTSVILISPMNGTQEIENPFLNN
ncbi:U6 snRNA-associated Sm-like protein LSm7 [Bifiguratus adelaidae]|uniref:U6 snRNA-associated Sm-like protein LSm7 n=1 Tax=Bifiguratus adelaidae TaxID=1938954 RepID=A0A261Y263_9FUNG|nr:U6 snRNA-associated Sm-like protein LSm7 [Bifiguratus adelaidae]